MGEERDPPKRTVDWRLNIYLGFLEGARVGGKYSIVFLESHGKSHILEKQGVNSIHSQNLRFAATIAGA